MFAGSRVALIVLLVLALLGGSLAGHAAAGPGPGASQPQVSGPTDDEPTLTMTVDLQPDGDARWHLSTSFNLTTEAERESFRELAQSFEDGETSALGLPAFRRASQEASDATGREMSITEVRRESSPESVIENGTGRLTVAFTWTDFARVEENRLYVDDVLETGPDGEMWLPGLDAGDTLVIRAPEGYGVAAASVAPESRDNRSVLQWTGPKTFEVNDLRAEFTGQAETPTPTPTPGTGPQRSLLWLLVISLGIGGGAVAVYLLSRREDGFDLPPTGGDVDADGGSVRADPAAGSDAARTEPDDSAETADETATEEESGAGMGIDEELLSDEERVERLLERNGGRMKQASIVKETGWSNAKVSQLLSAMEEEGRIDKLRIGRENLISFPDEDVTDIDE